MLCAESHKNYFRKEPQEFGVNVMGNYPLSEVLIIITAAIAADMAESVAEGLLFS